MQRGTRPGGYGGYGFRCTFVDEEGNERHEDHSVSWQEEVGDTSYQVYEYWFIGPFNDLENYRIYGIFHGSGEHIERDWRVEFCLE